MYLAVLLGGAALAGAGRVNFADVIVALPLSDQISQMFTALGHLGPMLAQRTPQAARVFAVIDLPGEEDGRAAAPAPGAGEPERPQPAGGAGADAVVFSHVTFTYPGADAPALRDVSFAIPAGCKTALLGESGSGKSTILRPDPGAVPAGQRAESPSTGKRLGAVPPGRWRAGLAVMPQDTVLFQRTIGQNIALADTPDPARLRAAAREADAAGFLEAAPGGYEAVPTQGSGGYSGGQLQRIALARALYRGAPVLLLDEPTSALDAGSEAAVADAIRALPRRYTVVAVTHRPALAEGFRPGAAGGERPGHSGLRGRRGGRSCQEPVRSLRGCRSFRRPRRLFPLRLSGLQGPAPCAAPLPPPALVGRAGGVVYWAKTEGGAAAPETEGRRYETGNSRRRVHRRRDGQDCAAAEPERPPGDRTVRGGGPPGRPGRSLRPGQRGAAGLRRVRGDAGRPGGGPCVHRPPPTPTITGRSGCAWPTASMFCARKPSPSTPARPKPPLREARDRGLLVTEAIWTRYQPMRRRIREVVESGEIGTPRLLTANLGYYNAQVPRIAPARAGRRGAAGHGGLPAELCRDGL